MKRAPLISSFVTLASLAAAFAACSSGSTDGTQPTGSAGTTLIPIAGSTGTAGTTPIGTGGSSSAGTNPTGTGGSVVSTGGTVEGTAGSVVGTSGSTATAGSGGTPPAGGASGTGGSVVGTGGNDNAGGHASGTSMGCATIPADALGTAVLKMIDITGMAAEYTAGYTHRKYCTTLPADYHTTTTDAKGVTHVSPYPVVFYGPGCGATACEGSSFTGRKDIIIVQAIAGADAKSPNIVPPNGAPGCFQAGKESTEDSPEGPYFDQVMAQVETDFCIDKGKVYAAGTSSGAWLSNYLACARGKAIRGTASDSGGIQFNRPTCTGGASVMEMPGDSANVKDSKGNDIGAAVARDLFIKTNGCSMTPTAMTFGGAGCQVYGGCASPVAWCDVGGGHQSGNGKLSAATQALWATLQ
jgi:hypothetical protein